MIKGGGRRSGGPISSSLPRHDAKDQKDRHKRDRERKIKKTKGRLQVSTENIEKTILYDA